MGPDAVKLEPISAAGIRRSTRSTKGVFQSTKYIDEVYLTTIDRRAHFDSHAAHLAYLAEVSACCDTEFENVVDPRAYAAKAPGSDPDMPTFHQANNGEHAEEWIKAMRHWFSNIPGQWF